MTLRSRRETARQHRRKLLVPVEDVRALMAGFVDGRRWAQEVVSSDLDRRNGIQISAVPEPESGFQDRRA